MPEPLSHDPFGRTSPRHGPGRGVAIVGALMMTALVGCGPDPDQADSAAAMSGDTTGAGSRAPDQAAGAPGSDTAEPGRCAATLVTGDSIGPLAIGATVDEIRARCTVVSDTTRPGAEGMPTRFLTVAMGRERVEAEIEDGRVWRIPVTTPRLRTGDGLGVGTPLAALLEIPRVRPAMGEGLYVLSPAHCGLSFQLENPGGPLPPAQTVEQLRRLPEGVKVGRVLVTGCEG